MTNKRCFSSALLVFVGAVFLGACGKPDCSALRSGMTQDEVKNLLGPADMSAEAKEKGVSLWFYGIKNKALLSTTGNGMVNHWQVSAACVVKLGHSKVLGADRNETLPVYSFPSLGDKSYYAE